MSDLTQPISGLKSAAETCDLLVKSGRIMITPERLTELANSGYVPHYRWRIGVPIDGKPLVDDQPVFRITEVRAWFVANGLNRDPGAPFPDITVIHSRSERPAANELPPELISLRQSLVSAPQPAQMSGVYFLVRDNRLVYIGQSKSVWRRIAVHSVEFDRAFVIPTPESDLSRIEGSLIRHFRPSDNVSSGPTPHIDHAAVVRALVRKS